MEYDVIVVGSGPGGSASTFFLSSTGLHVLCIDRLSEDRFERYHSICGECISQSAADCIRLRPEEIRNVINTFSLNWPGGVHTDVRIRGYIIDRVSVISRFRRDAESYGSIFIKGAVQCVSQSDGICKVVLTDGRSYSSKYLIGADGAYSVVRKQIFDSEPEFKIPVEMRIVDEHVPDGRISFGLVGKGRFYNWVFPSGGKSSVGAVVGCLESGEGLHGARIIPIGWVDSFIKGNVLLIGDAAGFVNPVSFGGLRIAFETARAAADSIASGRLLDYDRWWRRSSLSDRRFMKVMKEFESYDDEQYAEFSRHLGHGLYLSGLISVLCHPRKTWLYIGCLMAIRNGW